MKLEQKQGAAKFFLHLRLLLKKNFLLFWRQKKVTFFQLLMPVICCLLLLWFQHIAEVFAHIGRDEPIDTPLEQLEKCDGEDCVTVGFGIIGDAKIETDPEYDWIMHSMKFFARENQLTYGEDVKLLTVGTPRDYKEYLDDNQNKTLYGLVFCTTEWIDDIT